MIERICQNDLCDKHFFAKQADVNRGWGLFCSKSCKAVHQEQKKKENFMSKPIVKPNVKPNVKPKRTSSNKPLFSRTEFTENLYRRKLYDWNNSDYEYALKNLPSVQAATDYMFKIEKTLGK